MRGSLRVELPFWYELLADSDDSVVLDALDRAVGLEPGDPLFTDTRRLVAGWHTR